MNSLRTNFLIFLFAALTLVANADASMTYEYDLPGLVGIHRHIDQPLTIPFDLKTRFSSIASVEIRLEGQATPGLAVLTKAPPQDFVLPVEFRIKIADKFIRGVIDMGAPTTQLGPLQDYFQVQNYLTAKYKNAGTDWSFLQDGIGEIHFTWGSGCPDGCTYVNHASAEITRATLIIKGDAQY